MRFSSAGSLIATVTVGRRGQSSHAAGVNNPTNPATPVTRGVIFFKPAFRFTSTVQFTVVH